MRGILPEHQRLNLIYKASRDGWMPSDFHRATDGKGPTVTLVKSRPGLVCGGFTEVPWSDCGGYKEDVSAFVFSLSSRQTFHCKKPTQAVYHHQDQGPCFGLELLSVYGSPMNSEGSSFCWTGQKELDRYNVGPATKSGSVLTGELDNFTCREIEVYLLS